MSVQFFCFRHVFAPALLVNGIAALGHHPFPAPFTAEGNGIGAGPLEERRQLHPRIRRKRLRDFLEQLSPVLPLELEQ